MRETFVPTGPEGTVSAADLQNTHARCKLQPLVEPGKPPFRICRIEAVKRDAGGEVRSASVLGCKRALHAGQMDQVEHILPVDITAAELLLGITNRLGDRLHLFDAVLDEFFLYAKHPGDMAVVRPADGHTPDLLQRKAKVLEKQNLLERGKVPVCVKPGAVRIHKGGLEYILPIVEPDGPD